MMRRIWVILTIGLMALVFLRCSPTSDPGNGDVQFDRTTPDNLLNFVSKAYSDKEIDDYDDALHDAFEFEFTPEVASEVGLDPEKPWWGKVEDLISTGNMFSSSSVLGISMEYVKVDDWDICTQTIGGDEYSGLCIRLQPDIKVDVDEGEEVTQYHVNQSNIDVMVVKDPKYPEQNLWVVMRIKEQLINP
jgi:hypothetical protein